jgi:hypothetical protein
MDTETAPAIDLSVKSSGVHPKNASNAVVLIDTCGSKDNSFESVAKVHHFLLRDVTNRQSFWIVIGVVS